MMFADRDDAAKRLSNALRERGVSFDVVMALPRGGVALGAAVARDFQTPFGLIIPRKIGAPGNEEYAIGAVAEDGTSVWNEEEKERADDVELRKAVEAERKEAKRRRETYLVGRAPVDLRDKQVLIVDDGVATGLTMRLAIAVARKAGASRVLVAVPVAPADSMHVLEAEADQIVALAVPEDFGAIGQFYETFEQVTDDEVVRLMRAL